MQHKKLFPKDALSKSARHSLSEKAYQRGIFLAASEPRTAAPPALYENSKALPFILATAARMAEHIAIPVTQFIGL